MERLTFKGIKSLFLKNDDFYAILEIDNLKENNYYFLSNDLVNVKFQNIYNVPVTFIGIANPHCFHVISLVGKKCVFKRIIAIDCNAGQLHHFSKISHTVLNSNNRIEYLQNLFKVKFNNRAIKLLEGFKIPFWKRSYIHGCVRKDGYMESEETLWKNLVFDKNRFEEEYNLSVEGVDKGLLINSKTIGDFDRYYATFITASKADYKYHPFDTGYGFGFLRDEESFQNLKNILRDVPITLINEEMSKNYKNLLITNRYSPLIVWISNLLCDYFIEKNSGLKEIITLSERCGNNIDPQCPEIDINIIQDKRTEKELSKNIDNNYKTKRRLSVHALSFQSVFNYMKGKKCLEVVNVQRWIDEDAGVSKLPDTNYIYIDKFLNLQNDESFDSIFIHILVGHGSPISEYSKVLKKARLLTCNLIILEHNIASKDFIETKKGCLVKDIRNILGKEDVLEFCLGVKSKDRNILMVYRSKNNQCDR